MNRTQEIPGSSVTAQMVNGFEEAQKRAKSLFAAQKELIDSLQQMNEHWFARAKSEAEFAGALASKVASARSVPDATSVCQEWLSQRIQRYVEDSNHVLLDVQTFIRTGTRLVQNGQGGAPETPNQSAA